MRLQRQMPMGMLEYVVNGLLEDLLVALGITSITRLETEELRLRLQLEKVLNVLPLINNFEFINALDVEKGILG